MSRLPSADRSLAREIRQIKDQLKILASRSPFAVTNAALTDPLTPSTGHADASGFTVPTTWATLATITVPVPAGFTRALIVSLTTSASARNTSGAAGYLYATARIPIYGAMLPGYVISSPTVPAGAYGTATDQRSLLLTGLDGSFDIEAQVQATGAWSADVGNVANLDVALLFLH